MRYNSCYRGMEGRALAWHCMNRDYGMHPNGVNACKKCVRIGKFEKWVAAELELHEKMKANRSKSKK